MKTAIITIALAASAAFLLIAADSSTVQPNNLTVHEWGTFTSVAGADGSSIEWDTLGCKDDLPGFINAVGYRGFKFRLAGTVRMETPVIYFYSPREIVAHVQVRFPFGLITEWYPKADTEIYESKSLIDRMSGPMRSRIYTDSDVFQATNLLDAPPAGLDSTLVRLNPTLNGIDTSLRKVVSSIGWSEVKVQPGTTPDFPIESGHSRYYAARGTDAAPIAVGNQHEKFLFYRGVGRFQIPLTARVASDGAVTVGNRSTEPIPAAILFENREGHLGFRSVGAVNDSVTIQKPSLDGSFSQLLADLEAALVAQGLYPREAQAMVETWRDSWFEEGSRLIYIVPSHAIDTVLPLRVEPAASQTARVFVGRIELITPETKRTVEQAIAKGDWSALGRYARFLDPILKRISSEDSAQASQVDQFRRTQALGGIGQCQ
jgi:hypothetical protein